MSQIIAIGQSPHPRRTAVPATTSCTFRESPKCTNTLPDKSEAHQPQNIRQHRQSEFRTSTPTGQTLITIHRVRFGNIHHVVSSTTRFATDTGECNCWYHDLPAVQYLCQRLRARECQFSQLHHQDYRSTDHHEYLFE